MYDFRAQLEGTGSKVKFRVTGTFAPKNFRSRERKFHGMELSLP